MGSLMAALPAALTVSSGDAIVGQPTKGPTATEETLTWSFPFSLRCSARTIVLAIPNIVLALYALGISAVRLLGAPPSGRDCLRRASPGCLGLNLLSLVTVLGQRR